MSLLDIEREIITLEYLMEHKWGWAEIYPEKPHRFYKEFYYTYHPQCTEFCRPVHISIKIQIDWPRDLGYEGIPTITVIPWLECNVISNWYYKRKIEIVDNTVETLNMVTNEEYIKDKFWAFIY